MKTKYLLMLPLLILSCCGPTYLLKKAKKLEKDKKYGEAIEMYLKVANKYERYAPEALYRIGEVYRGLSMYEQAKKYYKEVIDCYPESEPWKEFSILGIFNSPDYFPLSENLIWIEGDSETKGKNMLAKIYYKHITTATAKMVKTIYAGKKLVTRIVKFYKKEEYQLKEYSDLKSEYFSVILKYPFKKGKSWITFKDGKKAKYSIVSTNAKVRAGDKTYENCLKIKIEYTALPQSFKYEYYAPNIGKVLTTTATTAKPSECRISELLRCYVRK